ncbi:hypothetical protein EDB83DRAFT_2652750, partial [Lactarius deliciosus]
KDRKNTLHRIYLQEASTGLPYRRRYPYCPPYTLVAVAVVISVSALHRTVVIVAVVVTAPPSLSSLLLPHRRHHYCCGYRGSGVWRGSGVVGNPRGAAVLVVIPTMAAHWQVFCQGNCVGINVSVSGRSLDGPILIYFGFVRVAPLSVSRPAVGARWFVRAMAGRWSGLQYWSMSGEKLPTLSPATSVLFPDVTSRNPLSTGGYNSMQRRRQRATSGIFFGAVVIAVFSLQWNRCGLPTTIIPRPRAIPTLTRPPTTPTPGHWQPDPRTTTTATGVSYPRKMRPIHCDPNRDEEDTGNDSSPSWWQCRRDDDHSESYGRKCVSVYASVTSLSYNTQLDSLIPFVLTTDRNDNDHGLTTTTTIATTSGEAAMAATETKGHRDGNSV